MNEYKPNEEYRFIEEVPPKKLREILKYFCSEETIFVINVISSFNAPELNIDLQFNLNEISVYVSTGLAERVRMIGITKFKYNMLLYKVLMILVPAVEEIVRLEKEDD